MEGWGVPRGHPRHTPAEPTAPPESASHLGPCWHPQRRWEDPWPRVGTAFPEVRSPSAQEPQLSLLWRRPGSKSARTGPAQAQPC